MSVRLDFQGHEAWVVFPKDEPIKGKPWTWCMQRANPLWLFGFLY